MQRLWAGALALPLLAGACLGGNGDEPPAVEPAPGVTVAAPTATPEPTLTPTPAAEPIAMPTPTVEPTPAFLAPEEISLLTLDDIFPPRETSELSFDPARLRTIIATGDVIPARAVDGTIRFLGDDFLYVVAATTHITSDADLTVISLEAPLIAGCPPHSSGFTFCGRPGFVEALSEAGVDIVTLENNHIGNYGPAGIEETRQHLAAAGIDFADRQTLAVHDIRGLRFGFLAFNGVGEEIDREAMVAQIALARSQVDVLAVAYHWGAEYEALPRAAPGLAPDDPVEIAHLAVDAGADLILGNHPHWVQAIELYRDGLIVYAHGNFIFDQMWSYETRISVIGRYTFYDDVLLRAEFMPVLIENYARPRPLEGEERQAVLDGMREASEELAATTPSNP